METTITDKFIILSLHPEKGRVRIDNTHLRYTLVGAILMDFLNNGEIKVNNKRIIPSFRRNGDLLHDYMIGKMERSVSPKRISFWISRLSMKMRLIIKETTVQLENRGILRIEKRYFLGFIPYNRYFFSDIRIRKELIDGLRDVLLQSKPSTREQTMLIGLITASRSHKLLVTEPGERRTLRLKCKEFMKKDELDPEIKQVIREIQSAISSAIASSAATAGAAAGV
jgi:hypothetical protein